MQVDGLACAGFGRPGCRPISAVPPARRYLPDADPTKTMLGDAQCAGSRPNSARPRTCVSSSAVSVVGGHGCKAVGQSPAGRERLYYLLRDTGARGVLILSGDRHIGGIYCETHVSVPYPVYELTSSGVTIPGPLLRRWDPTASGHW